MSAIFGYREHDAPSIEEIFAMSNDQLFSKKIAIVCTFYNNSCMSVQV